MLIDFCLAAVYKKLDPEVVVFLYSFRLGKGFHQLQGLFKLAVIP